MIIIGEKLNSSIPKTLEAMKSGDMSAIDALILPQIKAGAAYIDVNTALCDDEEQAMLAICARVRKTAPECGIMIDTTDTGIALRAAESLAGARLIFNSVTPYERMAEIAPLAARLGAGVVLMPMMKTGIPESAVERCDTAAEGIEALRSFGVADGCIFADIMAQALATGDKNPSVTLGTAELLRARFPEIHLTVGLSNISFGLPSRRMLNEAFLAMAIKCGTDSAICDAERLALPAAACEALLGRDEYCMDYITLYREQNDKD